ncbi:unnamed protein product, partial [Mycena citricolor]
MLEEYGSDSEDTVTSQLLSKGTVGQHGSSPRQNFLVPSSVQSGRSSHPSSAAPSPVPSRSTSPLPQFRHSVNSSSTSEEESETSAPLLRNRTRRSWWTDDSRSWWGQSPRRRRRSGRLYSSLRKWCRWLFTHPFFPRQPITIILTLILLSVFTIFVTLLLMYILNPDKDPLPWRAYCFASPAFPPTNLDSLPPAGILLGVFSIDSGYERRSLVRTTWAKHVRSRNGAGDGDGGLGTSRTIVRFVMGQPRKDFERRIRLEMEMYNDIVILPIPENMNDGKTHTFFSWASLNAWVPPVYNETGSKAPVYSYSSRSSPPPALAPHDPILAHKHQLEDTIAQPWVRPDFVIKADDDSFAMLAELEARLRVELHSPPEAGEIEPYTGDPLIYWGYLVTNRLHRFMAGELYALSWALVDWAAKDPAVKTLTRGAEDKQTAKWMKLHPLASQVRWVRIDIRNSYTHGFLFPSEAQRAKDNLVPFPHQALQDALNNSLMTGGTPSPSDWSYSSVSKFGVRYEPPIPDLTISQSVEALVEGSEMSTLREGNPKTPEYAWDRREGRKTRYQDKRLGGTVVVHYVKKSLWYLETALALLEGPELTGNEEAAPPVNLGQFGLLANSTASPASSTVETSDTDTDSILRTSINQQVSSNNTEPIQRISLRDCLFERVVQRLKGLI